jgi:hypothetical protein
MQAVGLVHAHEHHLVAVDPAPEALSPAPPLRATLVGCCPRDRLAALLAPWPHLVTALGAAVGDDLLATAQALCPAARTAALGRMQHPPLDGPVDRRPRVSRVTGA